MQNLMRNIHGFSGKKLLGVSRAALGTGLFLVLWLFCTAFILAPAQARVNSSALHPAHQSSLPAAWSRWQLVPPGDGATYNTPAATQFGNTLYLFVQGTDNKVYFKTLRNGTWSTWSVVPPGDGGTHHAPAATVFRGTLYLFVRGTDGKVYFKTLRNGTWSTWSVVPPGDGATPNAPAASVFGNTLYLFVQGTDNKVYFKTLS